MTPTGLLALAVCLAAPLAAAAAATAPQYHVAAASGAREPLLAAEDAAWAAAKTIVWGPSPYETRFRALWSEDGLLLRFDAADSAPWHTMTRRDDHLWEEEVVEIFIDPDRSGRDYYELEINPANVVCDLRMISAWPQKEGDIAWDLEGLETRVQEQKDPAGRTTGWTATAFLPWKGLSRLPSARRVALPPKAGDAWRFNVFRIKRPAGPAHPEEGAVEAAWSKPPGESFHVPAAFRDLVFDPPR
ncbi:MAG TPA: carbohydrate-binding family 9-like protein [Vicinamibacteria bacterium]|jgi:hypothetical protein